MELSNHQTAIKREIQESAMLMETENEVNVAGIQIQDTAVNLSNSRPTSSAQPTFEKFKKLRKIQGGSFSKTLKRKKQKREDKYAIFGDFVAQELRNLRLESNRRQLKRMIQKAILKVSAFEDKSEICIDERHQ